MTMTMNYNDKKITKIKIKIWSHIPTTSFYPAIQKEILVSRLKNKIENNSA